MTIQTTATFSVSIARKAPDCWIWSVTSKIQFWEKAKWNTRTTELSGIEEKIERAVEVSTSALNTLTSSPTISLYTSDGAIE